MSHTRYQAIGMTTEIGIGTAIFPRTTLFLPFSLAAPTPIGGHHYPPQSAPVQAQAPQGVSNFVDGSGPIFSMYLEMATEEDKKMAESWKADADGILIFVRLYLLIWSRRLTIVRRAVYFLLPSHR